MYVYSKKSTKNGNIVGLLTNWYWRINLFVPTSKNIVKCSLIVRKSVKCEKITIKNTLNFDVEKECLNCIHEVPWCLFAHQTEANRRQYINSSLSRFVKKPLIGAVWEVRDRGSFYAKCSYAHYHALIKKS